MKKLLIASCLTLLSSLLYGQDSIPTLSANTYFQFDMGIGYTRAHLSSINETLNNYGYEPFNENMATFSLSTNYFLNRLLIKSEFTWLIPQSVAQEDDLTTRFRGYSVGIGLGYAVVKKPSYRLTPYIGIIAYTGRLSFIDESPVQNIDEALNGTYRNSHLSFSNAALDVGIQMEKLIELKNRKWDCPQNTRLMTLGVRVGYNFGFGGTAGRYNGNQSITDAPTYAMQGPYVKAIIGFGSKIRDIKWKK